ncbi:hypothetical protein BDZ45DRAFT_772174 [Acephala macrosclerotiorum]|nr:hypothetical protein BDZ45DRAFT_772174 [Acephala macrosclerotiorum]
MLDCGQQRSDVKLPGAERSLRAVAQFPLREERLANHDGLATCPALVCSRRPFAPYTRGDQGSDFLVISGPLKNLESQNGALGPKLGSGKSTLDYFVYSTLPPTAIRLLQFKSGTCPDAIECALENFPHKNVLQYHTLSYCWGDPTRENSLHCNGKKTKFTTTLKEALGHLATLDRGDAQWIWSDQICMNQTDAEEKGTQVDLPEVGGHDHLSRSRHF